MSKYSEDCFLNRELSWLEFNDRVLSQALAPENPLCERLNFISIAVSNLDEFYMVRVASIRDQMHSGYEKPDASGLTPKQELVAISKRVRKMYKRLYRVYFDVLEELKQHEIYILSADELNEEQRRFCCKRFDSEIYPVVSPVSIRKEHRIPFIPGKSLNLAVLLESDDGGRFCNTVQVPVSPNERLVELPCSSGRSFILIEELMLSQIERLFPRQRVAACGVYRITRNGDIDVEADEAEDLLSAVKESLVRRQNGAVVRLEVGKGMDAGLLKKLQKALKIGDKGTFELDGAVDLTFVQKQLEKLPKGDELRYSPFTMRVPDRLQTDESIFDVIKKGDILLYHPFDSFSPVVRMLSEAADDPQVVAVKITLYRMSNNSPVIENLARAARKGKAVTAFIEARARFDEQNNIEYGVELEKAGVSVIYGLPKYKTHSKIAMVLRYEDDGIRKYLHLSTGNYNDVTAKLYTDFSLLTANMSLGADGVEFFRSVTAGLNEPDLEQLVMAPFALRERLNDEIDKQCALAKEGKPAEIFAKMNSLVDDGIIAKLYEASMSGVKIRLMVRGICCLRPGVEGFSENIEVRSIVGRFLEHSRAYCFGVGEAERIYLSSADCMNRNLNRRIELMFPLLESDIAAQVKGFMELYWQDNVKACIMKSNGKYALADRTDLLSCDAQDKLIYR